MQAVILGAGRGSRLDPDGLPKPLISLDEKGTTLLDLQLRALGNIPTTVVVGYKKELFFERYPHINFIESPHFASENTAKSLALAVDSMDGDLLWMNGDVLLHPSVLPKVMTSTRSTLVVNEDVAVDDEAVKYALDDSFAIVAVSKEVTPALGEAIGVNLFIKKDLPLLKSSLALSGPNDYFEKAIEGAIHAGASVWPLIISADQATEIDTPQDLERAKKLYSLWQ